MKFNKLISITLVISSVVILSRCTKYVQVYNLDDHQIENMGNTHPNKPNHISLANIKMVIVNTADSLGWAYTESQEKNILSFRQTIGDKLYAIKIPYNIKSYSVLYSKSINLNYNPQTKTIDNTYNEKVKNLVKAIDVQILLIQTEPDK